MKKEQKENKRYNRRMGSRFLDEVLVCQRAMEENYEEIIAVDQDYTAPYRYRIQILHNSRHRLPFYREAYAMQELNISGVAKICDIGTFGTKPMVVAEHHPVLPSPKSKKEAIKWLNVLANTFDTLYERKSPIKRIGLQDLRIDAYDKPILQNLGWFNHYQSTTPFRSKIEQLWLGQVQRMDLLSYLLIAYNWLFSEKDIWFPERVEDGVLWFLEHCTGERPTEELCTAKSIVEWLADFLSITFESKEDIFYAPHWSIEFFFFHQMPLSFVHVPQGSCRYKNTDLNVLQSTWISQKPISYQLIALILGRDISLLQKEGVSWFEAIRFCNQLSQLCGYQKVYQLTPRFGVERVPDAQGFRLPFEAEMAYCTRVATRFLFSTASKEWCQDSYLPERWSVESYEHDTFAQESKKIKEERVMYTPTAQDQQKPQKRIKDGTFRLVWNKERDE